VPAAAQTSVAPGWQLETTGLFYGEQARARVVEPMARLARQFANGRALSLGLAVDAITGASPTGGLPTGQVQTTTSASGQASTTTAGGLPTHAFQDLRGAVDVGWVEPLGTLVSASTSAHYSQEKDYASLGGGLKTKQKITGRLADALSELYLLACVLKRYEDDGKPAGDRHIVALCAHNGLWRFQQALRGAVDNFPSLPVRWLMRLAAFPLGARYKPAPDWLGHTCVELVLAPGEVRDRLTRYIYVSDNPNDPTGLLEVTFAKAVAAEAAEKKLDRAVRQGRVRRVHGTDWIGEAADQGVISDDEARLLREVEALTARVIAVDHFDPAELRPHYMTAGHNARAVQSAAAE